MNGRANPFADLSDLSGFAVKEPKPKPDRGIIEKLAEDASFPSRSPRPARPDEPTRQVSPRRYVTGRNRQINIKATDETIAKLYAIADHLNVPLGAVLEEALGLLAREKGL